ncbi:UDP-N-acetylmuramoyl-L-alanyl-D-glutamate--2,6-diaminopimelate ligase [bacterium]|nr:UDP-N-acetylmuramoyl-L-alanyl-D-glutamate--2,6-diaminopimelate ligase [bacterium]
MKKNLSELLSVTVKQVHGKTDVWVTGFSSDSRQIASDNMFFAVKGEQTDGNKFIHDAIKNGASVIVSEDPLEKVFDAVYVQVADIYQFMAESSARFYNTIDPALTIIGVTGTNGKTTTAHFINEIIKSCSIKTIFIGTTGIEICGKVFHTDYTTPPAFELHRILREGIDLQASHVIMEVSSHALKYKRVWGLKFDAAVFTNLSHEHLEIHPSMEDYFQTKLKLFSMLKIGGVGLTNADDKYGKQIINECRSVKLYDYGHTADKIKLIQLASVEATRVQSIVYEIGGSQYNFNIPMIGAYNAYNALAAAETLAALKFDRKTIHDAFMSIPPVAGRLEWYDIGETKVIIDFAHTPDGLDKLIKAVRELRKNNAQIITIFGCPGSRDISKRPLMGKIAAELSDYVIVTTDDIHFENPDRIIMDIVKDLEKTNLETVTDRREAIARGLQIAKKGDFLLIAGRGHEKYQYVKDRKIPFLDKDVLFEEAEKAGLRTQK